MKIMLFLVVLERLPYYASGYTYLGLIEADDKEKAQEKAKELAKDYGVSGFEVGGIGEMIQIASTPTTYSY